MNTLFKSFKKAVAIGVLSLSISVPAYADCSICSLHGAISSAANSIVAAINQIHARLEAMLESNFAEQPGMADVIRLNRELGESEEPITLAQDNVSFAGILGAIGPVSDADKDIKHENIKNELTSFKAGDLWAEELDGSSQDQRKYEAEQRCGSLRLSLNSLLGPLTYRTVEMKCDEGSPARTDRNQGDFAQSYIQLVSDLSDPLSDVNAKTAFREDDPEAEDILKLQTSSAYKEYLVARRNWLASWNTAYDSLTYLFNEHRSPEGNRDSQAELAQKIATQRTTNPEGQWYSNMQAAVGPVLQREMVFILAELQRDLHEMRKEQQRLIALQSVQLLQTLTQTKKLVQMKESGVKQKAQSITSKKQEDEEEEDRARRRAGQ